MRGSPSGSTWATQPVPAPRHDSGRRGGESGQFSSGAHDMLGRYVLRQQLGAGGMGVVHLATDPAGRAVAIKELPAHIAGDASARARLRREFTSLQRVDHPRVAPVLDADLDGARPYIVTRYIPGRSLEQRILDSGPLQRHELSRVAAGLAGALDAIHAAGVVHRDLKPTNVLMLGDDPVVIDFGISQAADDLRLTQVGLVMGTPGFLAPEVLDGAAATPGVDWWAWAATLTYAATGRPPFGRGPLEAVLARVHRGEPDLADVDPPLAGLLAAALAPDPSARPAPALLVAGMRDWGAGVPISFAPPTARIPARENAASATTPLASSGAPPPAASDEAPVSPATAVQPRVSTRAMPAVLREQSRRADEAAAAARVEPPVRYAGFGPPPARAPMSTESGWRVAGPRPVVPSAAEQARPGPWQPPAAQPPAWPPRRRSVAFPLLGLLALLVALVASWPVAAVGVALAWSALARTVYASIRGVQERRLDRGPRKSDGFVAVLLAPVRLVPAVLTSVLLVLGCLVVAVAGMFGTAALVSMTGGLRADPFSEISLAVGGAVAILVGWWGIGGTGLRRGSRAVMRAVAPGRLGPVLLGTLLTVIAAWLAIRLQGTGIGPDWAPLGDVISSTLVSWF